VKEMKLLALFFCLFVAQIFASKCLSVPPTLAKGSNCGSSDPFFTCQQGLYCSQIGVCTELVAVGGSCNATSQCVSGTNCKGYPTQMICVTNASPGEACSTIANSTSPTCGSSLACVNNICVNGRIGDSCKQNNNCQSNICNVVCQPIADYASCFPYFQYYTSCKPTSYCNGTICIPYITEGACSTASCGFGYYCAGVSSTDTNYQCVAAETRLTGQWCQDNGGFGQSGLCQSQRCLNGFCAQSSITTCNQDTGLNCALDQFCACDSVAYSYGYGTCQTNPCSKQNNALINCTMISCGGYTSNNDFSGSCINANCASQAAAYNTCSPASSLQASFFILTIIVLFVFLFSKN